MTTRTEDIQDEKDFRISVKLEGIIRIKAKNQEEAWVNAKRFLNHASSFDIADALDTVFTSDIEEVEEW